MDGGGGMDESGEGKGCVDKEPNCLFGGWTEIESRMNHERERKEGEVWCFQQREQSVFLVHFFHVSRNSVLLVFQFQPLN